MNKFILFSTLIYVFIKSGSKKLDGPYFRIEVGTIIARRDLQCGGAEKKGPPNNAGIMIC